jgi:phospholipid transport system substrate-binding protein
MTRTTQRMNPSERSLPVWVSAHWLRFACAALLFTVAGLARAAQLDAPTDVIRTAMDEVLGVLRSEGIAQKERQQKIEEITYSRFDFELMSRLVLAQNWLRLSDQQKAEFGAQFRRHISVTYGRRLNGYTDEIIHVIDAREAGHGDVIVQTKVAGGAASAEGISINYRLRERDGSWLVIDVIVEGISLIQNFRAQVQDIISAQGVDSLIRILRDKNAKAA